MPRQRKRIDEANELPARFVPRFWERDADSRSIAYREVSKRYQHLKTDAGVDSYQKELLAQRAIFIALQIETMEVSAMEGGHFEAGQYVQAVNALSGLLTKLGLEPRKPKTIDVATYLKQQDEDDE